MRHDASCDKYLGQLLPADDDTDAQKAGKVALAARFIAHELPATFVDDLQGDLDAEITEPRCSEVPRQLGNESEKTSPLEVTRFVCKLVTV